MRFQIKGTMKMLLLLRQQRPPPPPMLAVMQSHLLLNMVLCRYLVAVPFLSETLAAFSIWFGDFETRSLFALRWDSVTWRAPYVCSRSSICPAWIRSRVCPVAWRYTLGVAFDQCPAFVNVCPVAWDLRCEWKRERERAAKPNHGIYEFYIRLNSFLLGENFRMDKLALNKLSGA